VIFEGEDDTALGGFGEALLDGVLAPLEGFVLGVAGQNGLFAAGFHEVVEGADRAPATGVEADAGDAKERGDFDALQRVLDLATAERGIGIDEVLVDREADEVYAVTERVTFQVLQISAMLGGERGAFGQVELAVEDIDAGDAERGGFFDGGFDGHLGAAEMPERVGGDAELDRRARRGRGGG